MGKASVLKSVYSRLAAGSAFISSLKERKYCAFLLHKAQGEGSPEASAGVWPCSWASCGREPRRRTKHLAEMSPRLGRQSQPQRFRNRRETVPMIKYPINSS